MKDLYHIPDQKIDNSKKMGLLISDKHLNAIKGPNYEGFLYFFLYLVNNFPTEGYFGGCERTLSQKLLKYIL